MCSYIDFPNYLITIISAEDAPLPQRQTAAILLKSLVERNINMMDENVLMQLKGNLINALQYSPLQLAKLISNSIVTLLRLKGITNWFNVLQLINTLLISSNPNTIENTLFCLEQIYEDIEGIYISLKGDFELVVKSLMVALNSKELNNEARGCILRLLAFSYSVMKGEEFNKCVPSCVSVMSKYMQEIIKGGNIGETVRIGISKLAIEIVKDRKEEVVVIYKLLFAYHLLLLNAENQESFLISCDFWNEYMKSEWTKDHEAQKWNCLTEALPELIPKLLYGMKYTNEDLESLINDTEDDLKLKELINTYENIEAITARQVAFSLLEKLANTYKDTVLAIIKPLIDTLLNQDNWILRYSFINLISECAIYALGAISSGCELSMQSSIVNIVEFLFNGLENTCSYIRNTSCWTLARYAYSLSSIDGLFLRYLQELVKRIADTDQMVQYTACESLISLINEVPSKMALYGGDILEVFVSKLELCKGSMQTRIYFIIRKLLETPYKKKIKEDEECKNALLIVLLRQWDKLKDDDILLCSLMQCLSILISELGPVSEKFTKPLIERACKILNNLLHIIEADIETKGKKRPIITTQFALCSLDILSSLLYSLHSTIELYLESMGKVIISVLMLACQSKDIYIRQCGCGIIGDIIRNAKSYFKPYLTKLIEILLTFPFNDIDSMWALSEIAVAYPETTSQFALQCSNYLVNHLQIDKFQGENLQNAVVIIGRLGLYAPLEVSTNLPLILRSWCIAIKELSTDFKEECYRGLCNVVKSNLSGAIKDFGYFCDAIVDYPNRELEALFKEILTTVINRMPMKWKECYVQFPSELKAKLRDNFKFDIN